MTPMI